MGKSLQELSSEATAASVAWVPEDKVPAEFMPSAPPPQPGAYEFRLPRAMGACWNEITRSNVTGPRLEAEFTGDAALVITHAPGNRGVGEPFETRINNAERNRARRNEPQVMVSDGTYLLRALGHTAPTRTNGEFAKALMAQAGKVFGATVEWSWACGEKRNLRAQSDTGEYEDVRDGNGQPVMGCGYKAYQQDVQRDADGNYPLYIQCPGCARRKGLEQKVIEIRAFPNLRGFKPATHTGAQGTTPTASAPAGGGANLDDEVPF